MQVKATKLGFYNHKRYREGQTFVLAKKEDFSEKWMESLEPVEKPAKKESKKKELEQAE